MTTRHTPGASTATLLFFTKAPRPGEVKTRLASDTGAEAAAHLHAAFVQTLSRMLERSAGMLRREDEVNVSLVLARADGRHHPLFDEDILARREGGAPVWRELVQQGEDLGERLQRAITSLGEGAGKVLIIGSDSPTLDEAMIIDAVKALDEHDVVIGPSFDGGYYLIGLASATSVSVFDAITWSSAEVLDQTLQRCEEGALSVKLLPFWYDVDTIDDLHFLRTHLLQYLVASPAAQHYSSVVKELESLSAGHRERNNHSNEK